MNLCDVNKRISELKAEIKEAHKQDDCSDEVLEKITEVFTLFVLMLDRCLDNVGDAKDITAVTCTNCDQQYVVKLEDYSEFQLSMNGALRCPICGHEELPN